MEEYQNLRASVNELVGRINGRFGTVEFMPIHFMHRSVKFEELCALYAVSDVCLISSTRDGMNLVRLFLPSHAPLSLLRRLTLNRTIRYHTNISPVNKNDTERSFYQNSLVQLIR